MLRSYLNYIVIILLLGGCAATPPPPDTVTPPTATITVSPPTATMPPTALPAGTTRTDAAGIEQVWVPAGSFKQGTSTEEAALLTPPKWAKAALASEQPQHNVTLTQGFWLDKYEVTQAAFQAFVQAGYQEQRYWSEKGWAWSRGKPYVARCEATAPNEPQVCITWYEAEAYAQWRGGQLPTEAQWEYAARGPESLVYPWGNTFDPTRANVVESTGLVAVGSYPNGVSWVGAHDLSGNAMEWVQDWLDAKYYQKQVEIDPPGPAKGSRKIEKGGWWGSDPFVARAAYRHFEDPPTYQDHHIGLRVVSLE